jgi:hypothetical protein
MYAIRINARLKEEPSHASTRNAISPTVPSIETNEHLASYPAANLLLPLNVAPYFHSSSGPGMPKPNDTNPSKLFPHP